MCRRRCSIKPGRAGQGHQVLRAPGSLHFGLLLCMRQRLGSGDVLTNTIHRGPCVRHVGRRGIRGRMRCSALARYSLGSGGYPRATIPPPSLKKLKGRDQGHSARAQGHAAMAIGATDLLKVRKVPLVISPDREQEHLISCSTTRLTETFSHFYREVWVLDVNIRSVLIHRVQRARSRI